MPRDNQYSGPWASQGIAPKAGHVVSSDAEAAFAAQLKKDMASGVLGEANLKNIEAKKVVPISERQGFYEVLLSTADTRFSTTPTNYADRGIKVEAPNYGIVYMREGSTPGLAIEVDFEAGGKIPRIFPGAKVMARSEYFIVRIPLDIYQTVGSDGLPGLIRLQLLRQPDVDVEQLPQVIEGSRTGGIDLTTGNPISMSPAGANSGIQAYDETTLNQPTAVTDGVSLVGVTGMRIVVAGRTVGGNSPKFISGMVALWRNLPNMSALWAGTEENINITAGTRIWCSRDIEVKVPYGRVYAELRNVVTDQGSGGFNVYIQTWGA